MMNINDVYNNLCIECRKGFREGKIKTIFDVCEDCKFKFKSAWEEYQESITNEKTKRN